MRSKSYLSRYGIAFCTTTLAFLVTLTMGSSSERTAYALYVGSTLVTAFFGGMKAGLFATVLAAGLQAYQFRMLGSDLIPALILFVLVSLLASYLSCECVKAVRRASHLEDAFAGLQEGIVVTDTEGKIAFLNEAAQRLTGWPAPKALRQPYERVVRLVNEDSRRPILIESAPRLGEPDEATGTRFGVLLSKAGSEWAVEFEARPLIQSDGRPAGRILAFRDIGERRRDEKEIRHRAEQFHALASGTPVGLLFLDPAGQCLFSNRAFDELAGAGIEEARCLGWKQFIHPDDQPVADSWLTSVHQGESFSRELRLQTPQGRVRWVDLRSDLARSDQGRLLGHVSVFEDITEKKQRQNKHADELRLAQEQQTKMKQQFAVLEKDYKRLQEQMGERQRAGESLKAELAESRRREEDLRRQTAESSQKQLDERRRAEDTLRRQLAEAVQKQQAAQEEVKAKRQDDDKVREQLVQLRADLADAQRRFQEQLAEGQARETSLQKKLDDLIAEKQLAEEELRRQANEERTTWENERDASAQREVELRRQLEKRSKDHLGEAWLERVAARLRPMTVQLGDAVRTLTPRAAQGLEPPLCRLRLFIAGLNALAQLPRTAPKKQPVELGPLIHRIVEACSAVYRERQHHLTVSLPLEPEWLWGDPSQLELAVACLLDNAAQFTEPGGEIELKAGREGEDVVLRISDNGAGLSPDDISAVLGFGDDSSGFAGGPADRLRLGLPLARRLVEMHGGRLALASTGHGNGCEVVVQIPLANERLEQLQTADCRLQIAEKFDSPQSAI